MLTVFQYFGGRTQTILYDLDRVYVVSENLGNIIFVPAFEEYVKRIGYSVSLCRPRDPQSKGKVEEVIGYIKQSFLEGRIYTGMAELKTKEHDSDVFEFIKTFANNDQKRDDSFELVQLMQKVTGYPPKMWGSSMIGFGKYHYKSDRSSQEGDWPLVGFSPRKAAISLYVYSGLPEHEYLLKDLGKFTMGKACIYIKRLSDINTEALERLITQTVSFLENKYGRYSDI